MKQTILRSALAALFFAGLTNAVAAQSSYADRLAETRANYASDSWATGTVRDGLPVAGIVPAGMKSAALEVSEGLLELRLLPADAPLGARPLIQVQAKVGATGPEAREMLVHWLANLSSQRLAPEDSAFGVELGEAGYVGPSGAADRAVSWVAFVRGNVAVRLLNVDLKGNPELDLLAVASHVDAALQTRPALKPGQALSRPAIAKLAAASSAVTAGTPVLLSTTVTEPAGDLPTLTWTVGGSAQGYVESRGDQWYFFPTGPGEARVTLKAIGSNGTSTASTMTLSVADDD
ncbi:MAG: hypothetical protein AAF682_01600 [Planctomycetota bacterium]